MKAREGIRRYCMAGVSSRLVVHASLATFLPIVCLLALIAATSTSFITPDRFEHTLFLPDSPLLNALFALGFCLALWIARRRTVELRRRLEREDSLFRLIRAAIIAIGCIASATWVLSVQPMPRADQAMMQATVEAALRGDWSAFEASGYIGCYCGRRSASTPCHTSSCSSL